MFSTGYYMREMFAKLHPAKPKRLIGIHDHLSEV
jgi:hypothetical protein